MGRIVPGWSALDDSARLGGGGLLGSSGSNMLAAHGVLAATFLGTADDACKFFVSTSAPCAVFETSADSGAHWTRHPVEGLSNSKGSILVAADPVCPGTYTVAALDPRRRNGSSMSPTTPE